MKKITLISALMILLAAFTSDGGYVVGDKVADFKLKNIDEKLVSLADYKEAKGFIVIFTCNHCPYAVKYEDRIIALNNRYEAAGYPVIAINPNDAVQYPEDDFESMKKRAKEKKFSFPYLLDETQIIAKAFGAARTPHVFVLQKTAEGLTVRYIGAIDDNTENAAMAKSKYVELAVDALLAGKKVDTDFTKAIGCGIKWKK